MSATPRTFRTADSLLRHRTGQPIKILAVIRRPDSDHDAVLPMYRVRFPDGATHEAWRDELPATAPIPIPERQP